MDADRPASKVRIMRSRAKIFANFVGEGFSTPTPDCKNNRFLLGGLPTSRTRHSGTVRGNELPLFADFSKGVGCDDGLCDTLAANECVINFFVRSDGCGAEHTNFDVRQCLGKSDVVFFVSLVRNQLLLGLK